MNALIVGAGGFVGPYLVDAVHRSMNCDVIATKLLTEKVNITDAKIVDLNILDKEEIEKLLNDIRPEYIFHLAAISSVLLSWKRPAATIDVNVKGTLNLLESIRSLTYSPRVLIVGSGEEYGKTSPDQIPIKEDTALNPGNVYAITKATQNMLAKVYSQAYGMQLVMTRSFNHIGPGQSPQFVVADFCSQVATIERCTQNPVIRVGNLSAKRDFTDVRDVVKAYVLLIKKGKVGETYNVGSGHAVAIQDILNMIIAQSEKRIRIEIDQQKFRPIDVPVIEADISKIQGDTGWEPNICIDKSIKDTLDYWREGIE